MKKKTHRKIKYRLYNEMFNILVTIPNLILIYFEACLTIKNIRFVIKVWENLMKKNTTLSHCLLELKVTLTVTS